MGRRFTVRGVDAFGKTMEDVKIKTGFGGALTLISLSLILVLTLYEFVDYRRVHMDPSIVVDRSRGEKLVVNMNISFPRVPCYLLSVDIMDISGEHQNDIHHDLFKTRIAPTGTFVEEAIKGKELTGDAERVARQKAEGYCGTCYGGTPPTDGPNPGCCNTCDEVRESYVRRGWSFVNPDSVEQCVSEGWTQKIKDQADEGCNIAGKVRVNKVIGNFHLSPGRSFQTNQQHIHDLVPYLQGGKKHDFGHEIHSFSFGSESEDEFVGMGGKKATDVKKALGIVNPLDGIKAHTEESNYYIATVMLTRSGDSQHVPVVSTKFQFLDGRELNTHQYSVTQYERDLSNNKPNEKQGGHQTMHGYAGVPGLFFNYEISPLQVIHREDRQSFAHFITSTLAIIGGILTVAGLVDSFVYSGSRRLKEGGSGPKAGLGFASAQGKMLNGRLAKLTYPRDSLSLLFLVLLCRSSIRSMSTASGSSQGSQKSPTSATASSSKPSKLPTQRKPAATKGKNEGDGELSEEEFKQPALPNKKSKAAREGKQAVKKLAVLDLTAEDEEIEVVTSSSLASSPRASKKARTSTVNGKGKGKAVETDEVADEERSDDLWVDKYAPRDRDDLSIHARKITDVEKWFTEAFTLTSSDPNTKLAKYRRVLVLSGPAGAGKTATVRALAQEMDAEIVEWKEGSNVDYANDDARESLVHRFSSFLARAGMASALDFGPDPADPVSSTSAAMSSAELDEGSSSTRRLILLEDLPNVSHYPTKLALRSAISQYLTSPRVTSPLVVIVSEAMARPGDDDGGGADWLSGNGRRGESLDARSVLGVEVINHPACREISFNPIAPTIMRKALLRMLDRAYSSPNPPPTAARPSQATLDLLIAHSSGDIRSAVMSLQFLTTEGAGHATSFDAGGKGGKAKKGAKKGKKRKRGDDSSDEEAASLTSQGGKEKVKQLLQFVTARESSLFIFHALGKVLYNKRWGQSAEDDKKDLGRAGILQERQYDKLPRHLRKEWTRDPSKVDPDVLFAEAPLDTDVFLSYLHHNYSPFTNEIEECSGIMDALSESDALMTLQGEGEEAWRRLPLTFLYAFQVSVRSTLLNLPSPVPRRKQVLRKSELWETLKLRRQNEEGLDEMGGKEGLWREEKRSVVAERVPWMGVIKPKDANPFLLDLAAFPPLTEAAQPIVTGGALGEKEAALEEVDEEVLVNTSTPLLRTSVSVGSGKGGRARVLEELEDEDFADMHEAAHGERGPLLYDPDDDIED
ncbi:cell cycle checkpoint protein rad17 [Rhodotorula toruloides]|uniref:Cell cycle checkpoint protein rad17 n=1 Tax=Rhodotorula toruloides TaxID=5286 RepID=A0A511KNX7_RHOTO|nr:cell cycle checkpoint protein rad17 [Rhodotorula toruloides]